MKKVIAMNCHLKDMPLIYRQSVLKALAIRLCATRCFLLIIIMTVFACGSDHQVPKGKMPIRIWAHAGQESERATLIGQVSRFNEIQSDIEAQVTFIPEGSYNAQVQAAAVNGELPDVLEFDGPFLYAYIWQQRLIPLDGLLPEKVLSDLLPSIVAQGTYHNHLWSVGTFDSGLGLYGNLSKLKEAGIRIPRSLQEAWTGDEFIKILNRLARYDNDGAVLDLKLNYTPEWFTYAFSPFIQSAGGDLIDRKTYRHATGVINSMASVHALKMIQSLIQNGLVDPNIDDAAFVSGRVALSLGGHWNYQQYSNEFGTDLVLMPLPDLGHGPKTGQGSWNWAITASCSHPELGAKFLAFLLQPDEVLAMSNANGAVPGTKSAAAKSKLYNENGPLRLFLNQLVGGYAIPRPKTPAYPLITSEFQKVFDKIRTGSDVKRVLDKAAKVIDLEIQDNKGYPWREEPVKETNKQ